jgi:sugar phosphate isomerase/epimerase
MKRLLLLHDRIRQIAGTISRSVPDVRAGAILRGLTTSAYSAQNGILSLRFRGIYDRNMASTRDGGGYLMFKANSTNVFDILKEEDTFRRSKAAGFSRPDFNYSEYQTTILTERWTEKQEEAWAHRVRELADATGIRLTQMHGPVHGRSFSEMWCNLDIDSFFALVKRSLRTASILGIPWVVLHPTNRVAGQYESREEEIRFNSEFFKRLIPTLERLEVGIALENLYDRLHHQMGSLLRSVGAVPEELCELIDRIGHPLVGACWDTGHGHLQGLQQGRSIRMLGHRLKATHIQDNDGRKDQHLMPYLGTIDWSDTMAALLEIGYQGDFTYEIHHSIKVLPDPLKDIALRSAAEIADYLIESAGQS